MNLRQFLKLALAISVGTALPASAGTITFTNHIFDLTGTGKGNVLGVLSLQDDNDPDDDEWGATMWDGTDTVATTSEVVDTSNFLTRTAQELLDAGITQDNFALIFQVNEDGNPKDLDLNDFSLDFYAADGTVLFSAVYNEVGGETDNLLATGQGTSGFVFFVDLSNAEWSQFTANAGNRVGGSVLEQFAIANVGDGSDNFFLAPFDRENPPPPPTAVPEPSSLLLLGAGLGLFGLARRRGPRA